MLLSGQDLEILHRLREFQRPIKEACYHSKTDKPCEQPERLVERKGQHVEAAQEQHIGNALVKILAVKEELGARSE